MRPAYVVLHMEQGATYRDTLTLTTDAGLPVNLTGRSARMQMRDQYTDALVIELTTANGRIAPLTTTGIVAFKIPAVTLAAIGIQTDYAMYKFDLELTYMDGLEEIVERPVRGTAVLWKEVTV